MRTSKARTSSSHSPKNTTRPMIGANQRPAVLIAGLPPATTLRSAVSRAKNSLVSSCSGWRGRLSGIAIVGVDPPRSPGHDDHPVGQHHGLGDRVGDEHHRGVALLAQAQEEVAHLGARDLVQRREGLVHQQHRRVERERPDQRHPLLHATRQLVRVGVAGNRPGRPRSSSSSTAAGDETGVAAADVGQQAGVGRDGPPRQQPGRLGDEAELAGPLGGTGPAPPTVIVPLSISISPAISRSRVVLPHPGRPDQADELARRARELESARGPRWGRSAC